VEVWEDWLNGLEGLSGRLVHPWGWMRCMGSSTDSMLLCCIPPKGECRTFVYPPFGYLFPTWTPGHVPTRYMQLRRTSYGSPVGVFGSG